MDDICYFIIDGGKRESLPVVWYIIDRVNPPKSQKYAETPFLVPGLYIFCCCNPCGGGGGGGAVLEHTILPR